MRNHPYGFENYLVNVKTIRKIAQIFVAFSKKLNFIFRKTTLRYASNFYRHQMSTELNNYWELVENMKNTSFMVCTEGCKNVFLIPICIQNFWKEVFDFEQHFLLSYQRGSFTKNVLVKKLSPGSVNYP